MIVMGYRTRPDNGAFAFSKCVQCCGHASTLLGSHYSSADQRAQLLKLNRAALHGQRLGFDHPRRAY
jgi:hypothetical protein